MLVDNWSIVQIVMFAVFAIVVVVAVVWGAKRVKFKLPGGVEASIDPDEKRTVTVAKGAKFEDAKVGNVTGERRSGASGPARDVDVLSDGVIKGGSIGDITGVEETGPGDKK